MTGEYLNLKIVLILTFGFSLASLLGYITHRLKLSSILGYLLAGYVIGPYSPGYVADIKISEQLAEIGVILMMFGVGLHFRIKDLINVKNIAIPGALLQTIVTTLAGALIVAWYGWGLKTGIIIGLGIGVASTIVLVRILNDNKLIETEAGHICVGWTIVEDIITVLVLLVLPSLAGGKEYNFYAIFISILIAFAKFVLLTFLMFTAGKFGVSFVLSKIVRTKSDELFTLTVLALTFLIATGSAFIFGTSIALGSFIAGMVIGQTNVRHQVAKNTLPLRDAFVVMFFLTVGMIFNPAAIWEHFYLFAGILGIILFLKPISTFCFTMLLQYPYRVALTVSMALAQVGEFSFILSEEALKYNLMPDAGYDILVACALVSIALNPLLFHLLPHPQKNC